MLGKAALAALRRKKQSEKSWEQTQQQIVQLEQHIYSIENANINAETLESMKGAGKALKQIHKGMKVEDVDRTMYVFFFILVAAVGKKACFDN